MFSTLTRLRISTAGIHWLFGISVRCVVFWADEQGYVQDHMQHQCHLPNLDSISLENIASIVNDDRASAPRPLGVLVRCSPGIISSPGIMLTLFIPPTYTRHEKY
jgi:hypothetical protein